MKIIASILLCLLTLLCACQHDFDPIKDSDIRSVSFRIDTRNCLNDVLMQDGDSFYLGRHISLEKDYSIRVSCFCYNINDYLTDSATVYISSPDTTSITISHLNRTETYSFRFVVDVVKREFGILSTVWDYLSLNHLDQIYVTSLQTDSIPYRNILYTGCCNCSPDNQTIDVLLNRLSYTGYWVLHNANCADKWEGDYVDISSVYLDDIQVKNRCHFSFSYYFPSDSIIVHQVTGLAVNNIPYMMLCRQMVTSRDTAYLKLPQRTSRRPFVVDVDGETMKITSLTEF